MPTEHGATDINGAVRRLTSMYNGSEPERPTGEGETPSQQAPEVAAKGQTEEAETPQSDTGAESRRFKAKLDDREVEFELLSDDIDPDLVPKGLMMEADYRKKTMELSDTRKALEAKQGELDAKFNEAAELIQFEVDNLESEEMLELKQYDPEKYWNKVDQIKKRADKLSEWREKKQKDIEAKNQSLVEQEREKLTQLIPDWLDDSKKEAELAQVQTYLKDQGFDENEIAALGAPYDSRLLSMARKAAKFDLIQSQDIESKRVKPSPRVAEPSGGAKPRADDDAAAKAMNRARKTGKVRDAQAAIRAKLNFNR